MYGPALVALIRDDICERQQPAKWQVNQTWQDNLGALFTHDRIADTVYSTSTVDTATVGTTTLDYWAVIHTTQQWLHATRAVVIPAPANDNEIRIENLPASRTE